MSQQTASAPRPDQHVEQAAREVAANPWVDLLGRLGYAARGLVYLIIGILAIQAAVGAGGQVTDSRGALQTLIEQPFGKLMLGVVALGLVGYTLWRIVQAVADTEHKGREAKGLATRAGYLVIGLIYGGLALSAVRLLMGTPTNGDTSQEWTARLMSQPFGRWLVALAGLIIVGAGLFQIYKGYSAKFREELQLQEMSTTEQTWALRAGRVGFAAHGIVLSIVGIFLLLAALRFDPNQARGVGGALEALLAQPFGPWLLGLVALGLATYGTYSMVEARYRRMLR